MDGVFVIYICCLISVGGWCQLKKAIYLLNLIWLAKTRKVKAIEGASCTKISGILLDCKAFPIEI
jgi:hypothetical protein